MKKFFVGCMLSGFVFVGTNVFADKCTDLNATRTDVSTYQSWTCMSTSTPCTYGTKRTQIGLCP